MFFQTNDPGMENKCFNRCKKIIPAAIVRLYLYDEFPDFLHCVKTGTGSREFQSKARCYQTEFWYQLRVST